VPDRPNLAATRELLRACLAELGLLLAVTELIGEYPSPLVLVDGVDVTGAARTAEPPRPGRDQRRQPIPQPIDDLLLPHTTGLSTDIAIRKRPTYSI
jgi:hypothetical protein